VNRQRGKQAEKPSELLTDVQHTTISIAWETTKFFCHNNFNFTVSLVNFEIKLTQILANAITGKSLKEM
jgi:hypothetical protein